ncbi:MAG: hypothetical protein O6952_00175 [Planctomycetota bacterium]|nr:hypothetical protein [Planctomycetota bacterium]
MIRIGLIGLFVPVFLLLIAAAQQQQGVVLMKNGNRVIGIIEQHDWGVRVKNPFGLSGTHDIKKEEIFYVNTKGTSVPRDVLEKGDWTPEDKAREDYIKQYERVSKSLEDVIGITRKKLAQIRKQEDRVLLAQEYRNDALGFKARPPLGWRRVEDGNLVRFIGPMRIGSPPRIHVISMKAPDIPFKDLVYAYTKDLKDYHGESAKSWLQFDPVSKSDRDQWAVTFMVEKGDLRIKTRRYIVRKGGRVFLLVLYTDPREDDKNFDLFAHWRRNFVII